jgi:hypothetical protein
MLGWPPPCHPILVFTWYHLVRMRTLKAQACSEKWTMT